MAAWPLAAHAQQPDSMRRIGVLVSSEEGDAHGQSYVLAMRQKLESLGWVESRNIRIDYRWAGGDREKAQVFARELIGMNAKRHRHQHQPSDGSRRQETQTIPIVFASLGDPVGSGLVASLAAGGNVTGFPFSWTSSWAAK